MTRSVPSAFALGLALAAGIACAQTELRCNLNHPGGDREMSVVSLSAVGTITGFTWIYKRRGGGLCDIQASTFRVVAPEQVMEGKNGCQLLTWRQGGSITLALSPSTPQCQSYCTSRGAYDALLPVIIDGAGRGCREY